MPVLDQRQCSEFAARARRQAAPVAVPVPSSCSAHRAPCPKPLASLRVRTCKKNRGHRHRHQTSRRARPRLDAFSPGGTPSAAPTAPGLSLSKIPCSLLWLLTRNTPSSSKRPQPVSISRLPLHHHTSPRPPRIAGRILAPRNCMPQRCVGPCKALAGLGSFESGIVEGPVQRPSAQRHRRRVPRWIRPAYPKSH